MIYRAAAQWFVRMDEGEGVFTVGQGPASTLRQTCAGVPSKNTSFYPENGRVRLRDMIAGRPDWCISRQRNWGVPLPFFLHKQTGELHPDTMALIDKRRRPGAARRRRGLEPSLDPADLRCWADAAHYAKSNDILDVWFDSGSTF